MGKSQSEPQEKELQKQTDAVLRLLTKRGVLPNEKITNEKRRAALQKRQKESYHNIVTSYLARATWVMAPQIRLVSRLMPRIRTVTLAPLGGRPRLGY